MTTVKNISGDYAITVNGGAGTVTINGDLVVKGAQSSIETTDTYVTDNIIVLNAGETGSGVTLGYAGIEVDRGTQPNVAIRWDEGLQAFQATEDGTTWKYLLQGSTPGGLSNVSDDTDPALGGNLNITGYTIYDSANVVAMYTGTVSGGGSGIYVENTTATQELATQSAAIKYAIIFG